MLPFNPDQLGSLCRWQTNLPGQSHFIYFLFPTLHLMGLVCVTQTCSRENGEWQAHRELASQRTGLTENWPHRDLASQRSGLTENWPHTELASQNWPHIILHAQSCFQTCLGRQKRNTCLSVSWLLSPVSALSRCGSHCPFLSLSHSPCLFAPPSPPINPPCTPPPPLFRSPSTRKGSAVELANWPQRRPSLSLSVALAMRVCKSLANLKVILFFTANTERVPDNEGLWLVKTMKDNDFWDIVKHHTNSNFNQKNRYIFFLKFDIAIKTCTMLY